MEPFSHAGPSSRSNHGTGRGLIRLLYTSNPFYVVSADLVFVGLRMSLDTSGQTFEAGALMLALLGYTLLLATTGWLLIRYGKVWDDARTILLLVVAMFLAVSVTFDETLASAPSLGVRLYLGGLIFAVVVSEALLRGIRLRLPALFRVPYYLILALFFLYPIALAPRLRDPASPTLQWMLFGFSAVAGLLFLTLLPAVRRGARYLAHNGSPWPFPLYPWTLFGLLAAAVCGRAFYLCISFHFVGLVDRPDRIFAPYFLVPFLMALGLLLLEGGIVARRERTQRAAMLLMGGLPVLATLGYRHDPVFQGFLNLFVTTLGGTPLFLSLTAVTFVYAYAALRRVPLATTGLTCGLLALAVVRPMTFNEHQFDAPEPIFLVLAGMLQIAIGARLGESWRCLAGAFGLAAAASLSLAPIGLGGYEPVVVAHLTVLALLVVGLTFRDPLARALLGLAAVSLGLLALAAEWGRGASFEQVPLEVLRLYPLVIVLICAGIAVALHSQLYRGVAWLVFLGWTFAMSWEIYRDLRRIVAGLDLIVAGLLFFAVAALISLGKAGMLSRGSPRVESAMFDPAGGSFESSPDIP